MEGTYPYLGTRDELLREIEEARAIVMAKERLHEDPLECIVIWGIWEAVLELHLNQLELMDHQPWRQQANMEGVLKFRSDLP